jgi:TonB family protein
MNLAATSWGNAAPAGSGILEPRPPRGAAPPPVSRRLAAVTAASLIAHALLVAAVLRDPPSYVPAPVRAIPVEVVIEPSAQKPDYVRADSVRPPEATQNQPGAAPLAAGTRDSEAPIEAPDHFRAVAVPLPSGSGGEAMSYRFIVGGMLERVKHYPEPARQRGAKGTATIGFVLDGSGGVASVALLRSSGEAELDAESVALVRRAAPYPAAPPGAQHSFTIEVAFGMGN